MKSHGGGKKGNKQKITDFFSHSIYIVINSWTPPRQRGKRNNIKLKYRFPKKWFANYLKMLYIHIFKKMFLYKKKKKILQWKQQVSIVHCLTEGICPEACTLYWSWTFSKVGAGLGKELASLCSTMTHFPNLKEVFPHVNTCKLENFNSALYCLCKQSYFILNHYTTNQSIRHRLKGPRVKCYLKTENMVVKSGQMFN